MKCIKESKMGIETGYFGRVYRSGSSFVGKRPFRRGVVRWSSLYRKRLWGPPRNTVSDQI